MVTHGLLRKGALLAKTQAVRGVPFTRYAFMATIATLVCGFIIGLSVGIIQGDVWRSVGASSIVLMEGLAGGILALFGLSRLMPRLSHLSSGYWRTLCLSYLPYAVSGAVAAAFGLFVRLAIPGEVFHLAWWQNVVITLLTAFVWVLMGAQANRAQEREETIRAYVTELEEEIAHRKVAQQALRKAHDGLEVRVSERTAELSASNTLLGHELVERKRAEEKLHDLYEQERELSGKLEAEMKKRVEFSRVLVHELKTPLTAIVAGGEMLADLVQGESLLRLARSINQAADNLNARINELFDLAKGELGMLKLDRKPVDPLELLGAVTEEMRPVASLRGRTLVCSLPPSLPMIRADEDRLHQVVLNLLSNAFKWAPEGGEITLTAKGEDADLIVEVNDTGSGIPEEDQQRLFEMYYRRESDRERVDGLGIGLSLCKILIDLHGGRMWVRSRPGEGSTFGFSVPLE